MGHRIDELPVITTPSDSDKVVVEHDSLTSQITLARLIAAERSRLDQLESASQNLGDEITSINNSLANSLHGVATVLSNGNKTLSIGGGTRALVGVFGFSNEATQIYIVTSTSGGATYAFPVKTSTGMSASISGTTMTLTNSTGSNAYVCAVVFSGSVESA